MDSRTAGQQAIDEFLASLQNVGPITVEQRRWVLAELTVFTAATSGKDEGALTLDDLMDPFNVLAWLDAARMPGQVPVRRIGRLDAPAAADSQSARQATLRQFAAFTGQPLPELDHISRAARAPVFAPPVLTAFMSRLHANPPKGVQFAAWKRFGAVAFIMYETAIIEKDLVALAHHQYQGIAGTLEIDGMGGPLTYSLSTAACIALDEWLAVRANLTAPLEGGEIVPMWVRVGPASSGSTGIAPGLPVTVRGLRKNWGEIIGCLEPALGVTGLTIQAIRMARKDVVAAPTIGAR